LVSTQQEERDLLYSMRALQVLVGSGIGLETSMHIIGRGGYGVISDDFATILTNLGRGARLEEELAKIHTRSKSTSYRRFINTLRNNVANDTDLLRSLEQQAEREEEERNEKMKEYIEVLSGLPTLMLTFGMLAPIIFGSVAVIPLMMSADNPFIDMGTLSTAAGCFGPSLILSVIAMAFVGMRAHTQDPGV
jgi:pilus assembly protein TadC